jgi:hypothetical protein
MQPIWAGVHYVTVIAWGWWSPQALAEDGGAIAPDLPDVLALAVGAVLG